MPSTDFLRRHGVLSVKTGELRIEPDGIYFEAQWKSDKGEDCNSSIFVYYEQERSFVTISVVETKQGREDFRKMYLPDILAIASPGLFRMVCDTLSACNDPRARNIVSLILKEAQVP